MEGRWTIQYNTGITSEITFYVNGIFYQKYRNYVGKWVLKNKKLYMRFPIFCRSIYVASVSENEFRGCLYGSGYERGLLGYNAVKADNVLHESPFQCYLPDIDIDGLEYENTREDEICLNEVDFLIGKLFGWGEFAIDKIKNIYMENKNLPKKPLFKYIEKTRDIFSDETLCYYCDLLHWPSFLKIFHTVENKKCRQQLAYYLIKCHPSLEFPSHFKFRKDDIIENCLNTDDIFYLVDNDLYDFSDEFFQENLDILDKTAENSISSNHFFNILTKINLLPLEKIEKYMLNLFNKATDNENNEKIMHRLLELYKTRVLVDEMAPTGIGGKLIIDSLQKKHTATHE